MYKGLLEVAANSSTISILAIILGPAGLISFILAWWRYKKKDVADVNYRNANTVKTDAESEKIKAEAIEIKSKADSTVADVALKIAQRLNEEINNTKTELNQKEITLNKTQEDLNSVRASLRDALDKIDELEKQLNKERENNEIQKKDNTYLQAQILELTQQISNFKNEPKL